MELNKTINVATAPSCKSRIWQNSTCTVENFVNALREPKAIGLPFADFVSLPKEEQFKYKDVGGYVGGVLEGGKRKAGSVLSRDFITLDFDDLAAGTADVIRYKLQMVYGWASVVYSTAKHCADEPRLRVIVFLNRLVTAEEYEPVARYAANLIGIEGADKTTYQAERMMFWPAKCSDAEYVFFDNVQTGSELDVDTVLNRQVTI